MIGQNPTYEQIRAELRMAIWTALAGMDHVPGTIPQKADALSYDVIDNFEKAALAMVLEERRACLDCVDSPFASVGTDCPHEARRLIRKAIVARGDLEDEET